mmetsp:Transcript_16974/g.27420  ORF Transcript_16974/g.27420 Transcript_16974/m.27420 type:complete len:102 (-) Transcript_16974:238-543(-)
MVGYCNYVSTLPACQTTFNYVVEDSVPGLDSFLRNVADAFKKEPMFQDSLLVSLMKAAVTTLLHGSNAATEEKVINFYRFLQTYSPNTARIVSRNTFIPSA